MSAAAPIIHNPDDQGNGQAEIVMVPPAFIGRRRV
jgi:hypothetical protein